MRSKKLVSSMAITLTAIFVALGAIFVYAYDGIKQIIKDGINSLPIPAMLLVLLAPVIAGLCVILIVLCLIGASKAKKEQSAKGLFVTIAIIQFLLAILMLAKAALILGELLEGVSSFQAAITILLAFGAFWAFPFLLAGIAIFVAFIKTCKGNAKDK